MAFTAETNRSNQPLRLPDKVAYLHESRYLAQALVSFMVLSGVVKVDEDGQWNA